MSNKPPTTSGTSVGQKRGMTSSLSAPGDVPQGSTTGEDLPNGRKKVGGDRSSASVAAAILKAEAKNNPVSKMMQKQTSLSGSTPNIQRSMSMNGKSGHKSASGKPIRGQPVKTGSTSTVKPKSPSELGAEALTVETNQNRHSDPEAQESGAASEFLTVVKKPTSLEIPEFLHLSQDNSELIKKVATSPIDNTTSLTNGATKVEGENLLNTADVPVDEAGTSSNQRKIGISLPTSPLDLDDIRSQANGFSKGKMNRKNFPPTSSRSATRKFTNLCNESCSGLHFCLQAIPNVPTFCPIPPTSTIGTGSGISTGNEATGDPTDTGNQHSDEPRVIQPQIGILEAFNNLHTIRNLAINSGLCSLQDYRNFSEIESLILKVFKNEGSPMP